MPGSRGRQRPCTRRAAPERCRLHRYGSPTGHRHPHRDDRILDVARPAALKSRSAYAALMSGTHNAAEQGTRRCHPHWFMLDDAGAATDGGEATAA